MIKRRHKVDKRDNKRYKALSSELLRVEKLMDSIQASTNSNYFYTITAVSKKKDVMSRMWGAFDQLKKAEKAAKWNTEFLSENKHFEYIVIEKYRFNMLTQVAEQVVWYKNKGDELKKLKNKPRCIEKNVVNYAFG